LICAYFFYTRFKVGLATDRKIDIALNIESARKTESSVSFAAQTRIYAAAAIGHQNQGKAGAFSYIKRFLGADAREKKSVSDAYARSRPKGYRNSEGRWPG
jgi:molecular chaperone DnaK (HSP70)